MSYQMGPHASHSTQESHLDSDPYSTSTDALQNQSYQHQQEEHYYPPPNNRQSSMKEYDIDYTDKPISRGSVAAQMAAEGQIPKKEGLRMWRSDERSGALMRGGRGKCCGRVCGCVFLLVIILVVGIIAAFFLWVRPPSVQFNGVEPPSTGSEVTVQQGGFMLNFNLNIGVINPNFFGANFNKISATAFYSTAPTVPFGGGSLSGVDIPKNSNTTIHFPFAVNYTSSADPNLTVLRDIATKCGFIGNTISQLTVDYTIALRINVLGLNVTPQFSSSTSFACPLSQSDITGLLGAGGLAGLGSKRSESKSVQDLFDSATNQDGVSLLEESKVQEVMQKVLERSWKEMNLVAKY